MEKAKTPVFVEKYKDDGSIVEFSETLDEFKEREERENLRCLGKFGMAQRFRNGVCEYWVFLNVSLEN